MIAMNKISKSNEIIQIKKMTLKYINSIIIHKDFIKEKKKNLEFKDYFYIPKPNYYIEKIELNGSNIIFKSIESFFGNEKILSYIILPVVVVRNNLFGLKDGIYYFDVEKNSIYKYKEKIDNNITDIMNNNNCDCLFFFCIDIQQSIYIYEELGLLKCVTGIGKLVQFMKDNTPYTFSDELLFPQSNVSKDLDINMKELIPIISVILTDV